jgi:large conductance mechanosensitive channel
MIIMPPIGLMLGGIDFSNFYVVLREGAAASDPYAALADAQAAGAVTINYGVFVNSIISFVIVAFALFLVIRAMNKLKTKKEEKPAHPPEDVLLLREIRDVLKAK